MALSLKAIPFVLGALLTLTVPLSSQDPSSDPNTPVSNLQINSRAVLVDVIVTDRSGKPVTGLPKDAFTVTEQGKPQTISFFEEHSGAPAAARVEMPKYPPDVFSNFSPFPQPAAVNVLLLDSLNTRMENQQFVHKQAMKFLKDLKPGSRMAIFTMGLGLHFIQGFTDDPALLFAALSDRKNNEVQASAMLKGQEETNAQQNLIGMMSAAVGDRGGSSAANPEMIAALQGFILENDTSQDTDRVLITLRNLQRLATFLNGFPGRKNVIWFSESPLVAKRVDPQVEEEWDKTFNMLAAARVALYPVDARGVATLGFYQADNKLNGSISMPSQIIGPPPAGKNTSGGVQSTTLMGEAEQRGSDQANMQRLANETGGRAFVNTNGLSEVMAKINNESGDFYTISYTPTDPKMDGTYRNIDVKVAGGKFEVSYRRGYLARDADLPGAALTTRDQALDEFAAQNPGQVDPLLPFMDMGMPQSEQISYKVKVEPVPPSTDAAAADQTGQHGHGQSYSLDFAIDLKDLDLKLTPDGLHKGMVSVSLIAYDRNGKIGSRKDFLADLKIKPDVYSVFEKTGVKLHAGIEVPKGQFWLRTGVFDQKSRKVGTMEVALTSVVPVPVAMAPKEAMQSDSAKAPVPVPSADAVPLVRAGGVTVEQLERTIAGAHGKKDQDLAKKLGEMKLGERLSTPRLTKIQAVLPGEKSRLALLALADASAFLQLPAAEIPATPPPDLPTQKLMLNKAAENLVSAIRKLPDFFAHQTTTRFHDLKVSYLSPGSAPVVVEHQAFQALDSFTDSVYYRDGKEVEEPNQKQSKDKPRPSVGLVNWGVFGQLQRIVVADIYMGKLEWSHWEQRASGPVAVFRYSIPKDKSTYVVNYCCIGGMPNQASHEFRSTPPFHGEIAIDPVTGSVYRLVIITELSPSDPIFQAEIMVEYESVQIGGQTYVCPRKSVTVSTAVAPVFRQQCWGGVNSANGCGQFATSSAKDTAINDTEYDSSSYHVFRSEVRILSAAEAGREDKAPAASPGGPPPTEPGRP